MTNVLFVGTAGCGKTSLTYKFGNWLESQLGVKVSYINLDAGAENLPYEPDYDVRKLFTIGELMRSENLGPNGAMIRAAELLCEKISDILSHIRKLDSDFKLVDTPGQMEIFVFREAGPKLTELLKDHDHTVCVYIVDPVLASSASGLGISISLFISTQVRLAVPTIAVINKADVVDIKNVQKMLNDLNYMAEKIKSEQGVFSELALNYVNTLRPFLRSMRLEVVSAKTGHNMDKIYDLISEAFCVCGDLS